MVCTKLFISAIAVLACAAAALSDYHSAKCVAHDTGCNQRLSDIADNYCEPHRAAHHQDNCCKARACHYCLSHRHVDICNYSSLKAQCFSWYGQATSYKCNKGNGQGQGQGNTYYHRGHHHGHRGNRGHHGRRRNNGYKAPPPSSHGGCIWRQGHGKWSVVINPSGWARGNWRESGDSITYMPWQYNGHHIDGQGSSTISFKFTVRHAGEYRLTAKTYAPHITEYNDMWVRFNGGATLKVAKHGHQYWSGGWFKCYQNSYSSLELFTKDHDPHSLITPHLNPGQVYTVDISGRSSRFKVERIIIKHTHHLHNNDLTVSKCY